MNKEWMLKHHLEGRGINDSRVLDAMCKVPREKFVPKESRNDSYADRPLPIGLNQTISQPYIVALMSQLLELNGNEKVLEIGCGSGYQSAVLSELAREVYSIEIIKELAKRAESTLRELGYNVQVKQGDGYDGWMEFAPYDAIMITAATKKVPELLFEQLRVGGRLVAPIERSAFGQDLVLFTKKKEGFEERFITGVIFVPMTGKIRE